jgi:hypothetical protein
MLAPSAPWQSRNLRTAQILRRLGQISASGPFARQRSDCFGSTPTDQTASVVTLTLVRASDFFEDFADGLCPDDWLGLSFVLIKVVHYGDLQFTDTLEHSGSDAVAGDQAKEAFFWLSQDTEVGVKCIWKRGCFSIQALTAEFL